MSLTQASKVSFPYTFNQLLETAKKPPILYENDLQQRAAIVKFPDFYNMLFFNCERSSSEEA
ncbi:hypothetical protein BELL_0365g00050 [Botrytis elliptica]|uniref:Uncharacterized protein n=1 Tax=Botrytis elliptica TaxID=278938 RepID=A0A4Z1JI71_9HELO|nr:hypothetical protein BELL_0365g00050 [Botrytis elliptica]